MSSEWFDCTEPSRTSVVTRCVEYLYTVSEWFNPLEPPRTFSNHFSAQKKQGGSRDFQELPNLLDELGSLSVFQLNPERLQRVGLIDVLGDTSPLVEAIMDRVKVSAGAPVDQALNYELAPSTPLNWNDVVCVLNAIIGLHCRDMKGICAHFTIHLHQT